MDQRTARSPVPIDEGMDGLELRMSDGSLGDGGKSVFVREGAEIGHEVGDPVRGRGDVGRRARVVGASADPVLDVPIATAVLLKAGPLEQATMNLQEEVSRDLVTGSNAFDAIHHGVDVPQHFGRGDVRSIVAKLSCSFRPQQATRADLQPFDPRGGDGFRSQQDAGECLRIDEACRFNVQSGDRRFGDGDVGGDVAVDREGASGEQVGDVGFVLAGSIVLAGRTRAVAEPAAANNRRQEFSLLTDSVQP